MESDDFLAKIGDPTKRDSVGIILISGIMGTTDTWLSTNSLGRIPLNYFE